MNTNQKRYTSLTTRLRERAATFPRALQRLGDALWNETDNPQATSAASGAAHTACLELLPEVVDAELAGESILKRFAAVKHHLDRCDECAQEYAELLEADWAEQRGLLDTALVPSPPDPSFLPLLKRPLQTIALEWTRAILLQLAPKNLGDLDLVANTVFAQLTPRRAAEGRSPYSHVLGNDVRLTDSARTLLTAGYSSVQEIVAQVTRAEYETWMQSRKLEPEMEIRALGAARTLGLDYDAAKRFAHAFAAQVTQDPRVLREFLK